MYFSADFLDKLYCEYAIRSLNCLEIKLFCIS
jgi:hypothetical protein